MSQEQKPLLDFPCDFPLKIMGRMEATFSQEILALVQTHAPDFDGSTMEMRSSAKGNYLSVTCTIRATSREQLDNLYRALTAHPLVKVVL